MWQDAVRVAGLAAVLAACGGVKESAFQEQYVDGFCELIVSCASESIAAALYDYASVDECTAKYGVDLANSVSSCEYDRKQAKLCVEAFESATCAAVDAGTLPECVSVYSGAACGWLGAAITTEPSTTPTSSDTASR